MLSVKCAFTFWKNGKYNEESQGFFAATLLMLWVKGNDLLFYSYSPGGVCNNPPPMLLCQ